MAVSIRKACSLIFKIPMDAVPDIIPVSSCLSYVEEGCRTLHIGLLSRYFGNPYRSSLHELVHVLLEDVPLTDKEIRVFGSRKSWYGTQQWWKYILPNSRYITRYAATHPEEDFAETIVSLLQFATFPAGYAKKVQVAESWLAAVRARY